jgi:hypothetical protein
VDEVRLADFFASRELEPGPIEASRLDREIARFLEVPSNTIVWISEWTLTKTAFNHPDIDFQDYLKIPEILGQGFAIPGNQRNALEIRYIDTHAPIYRMWRVVLKVTRIREVFVTSFSRTHMKDTRRTYRRALRTKTLLRDIKNQLARTVLMRSRQSAT